jgi:hypothetical protein
VGICTQGGAQYFHDEAEIGFAKAAQSKNVLYSLSPFSHVKWEDICAATPGAKKLIEIDL